MGNPQGMMGAGMSVSAVNSVAGGIAGANSARAQGAVSQSLNDINASRDNLMATEATLKGDVASRQLAQRTKLLIGSQRASAAAGGVDVNKGSAALVQEDTAGSSAIDQLTIKNNAMMEAFGFQMQGESSTFQGKMAAAAGKNAAGNTLLTGGLNAVSYGLRSGYYYSGGH
jgi:hypothetical protein